MSYDASPFAYVACPNDPSHNRFVVIANIVEQWLVDCKGQYIETLENISYVVPGPSDARAWTCRECGAVGVERKEMR